MYLILGFGGFANVYKLNCLRRKFRGGRRGFFAFRRGAVLLLCCVGRCVGAHGADAHVKMGGLRTLHHDSYLSEKKNARATRRAT